MRKREKSFEILYSFRHPTKTHPIYLFYTLKGDPRVHISYVYSRPGANLRRSLASHVSGIIRRLRHSSYYDPWKVTSYCAKELDPVKAGVPAELWETLTAQLALEVL